MVGSTEVYKSLNLNTRTVMKNSKILKFLPDHLKTIKNVSACS